MNNIENNIKNIYKIYKTEGLKYYAKNNMGTGEKEIVGYMGNFGFLQKVIEENQPDNASCFNRLRDMESKYLTYRPGFTLEARNVITDFLTYIFKNDEDYNPNFDNDTANAYQKSDFERKVFNTDTFAKNGSTGADKVIHENKLDKLSISLRSEFGGVNQYGVYLFQKCIHGDFKIDSVPSDFSFPKEYSNYYENVVNLFSIEHIGKKEFKENYKNKYNNLNESSVKKKLCQLYLLCNEVHRFVSEEIHGDDGLKVSNEMPYEITDENFEFYYKLLYNFMWLICQVVYPKSMKGLQKTRDNDLFGQCLIDIYAPFSSLSDEITGSIPLPQSISGREYYVSIDGTALGSIYIFSDEDCGSRLSSVLSKTSEDKIELDNSIKYMPDMIIKKDKDGKKTVKQMFRIPGYPIALGKCLYSAIQKDQKESIFNNVCGMVNKLHGDDYVVRNICADSFVVCKITDKKTRLVYWDPKTIKGVDNNGSTVIGSVANKDEHYLSPKVRNEIKNNEVSDKGLEYWKKADLYALGMLGVKLFTNKTYESISKTTIQEIKKDIPEECVGKIEEYLTKYDNEQDIRKVAKEKESSQKSK